MWCADKVNNVFPYATAFMLVNNTDTILDIRKVLPKVEMVYAETERIGAGWRPAVKIDRLIFSVPQVKNMIEDIRVTFQRSIENADWIDQPSRSAAIKKLKNMRTCVGIPSWLRRPEALDEYYKQYGYAEVRFYALAFKYIGSVFLYAYKVLHVDVCRYAYYIFQYSQNENTYIFHYRRSVAKV